MYDRRVGEGSEGGSILRDMVQVLDALGVVSECGVFFYEGFCTKHGGLEDSVTYYLQLFGGWSAFFIW